MHILSSLSLSLFCVLLLPFPPSPLTIREIGLEIPNCIKGILSTSFPPPLSSINQELSQAYRTLILRNKIRETLFEVWIIFLTNFLVPAVSHHLYPYTTRNPKQQQQPHQQKKSSFARRAKALPSLTSNKTRRRTRSVILSPPPSLRQLFFSLLFPTKGKKKRSCTFFAPQGTVFLFSLYVGWGHFLITRRGKGEAGIEWPEKKAQ